MKRFIPLALILLSPVFAEAQETYSVSASVAQVAELRHYTLALNRATCRSLSLPATCTQAQACPGCTNAQARQQDRRIWPDSQAGREEFVIFVWIAPDYDAIRTATPGKVLEDYCAWFRAQNQAGKDAECSKIGAPASCNVCQ